MAVDHVLLDLGNLPDLIDKVEFKGTVVGSDLAVVEAMVAQSGVDPAPGAVYFYDTQGACALRPIRDPTRADPGG